MAGRARKAPAADRAAQGNDTAKAGFLIYRPSDGNPIAVYRRETPAAVFAMRNHFMMAPLLDGELLEDAISKHQQAFRNGAGPAADAASAGGGKPAADSAAASVKPA